MREELSFWVVVGIVAIVAIGLFKLAATTKAGDAVPALRKYAAFI